ncbi:MAG: hypothetical protein KatS3mg131_2571 [Candidatus Tectimicrobiota bacterium]|nr:MAG: hypothetical protein KatS3mg131_2571 [Candidatus Tectomicrobia bacterium]
MAQLAALTLRHEPVDVVPPLRQALALLRQSPVARRRLVLISDFTTQGWEDFHAGRLGTLPQGMVLHFLRIGGEQRDANVLVEDLQLHDAPLIAGAPLRATATVYNAGREPVHNLRLELLLAHEKVGEQLVDLTPEARVTVPFRFTAPAAGLHWGVVRLAGDRFSPDDQFFYALRTVTSGAPPGGGWRSRHLALRQRDLFPHQRLAAPGRFGTGGVLPQARHLGRLGPRAPGRLPGSDSL